MSLFNIKQTDPSTDPLTSAVFAQALDAWTEELDDSALEFSLLGLKLFENVNGFFPGLGKHTSTQQFLTDLNQFILSWPSKEELQEADAIDQQKAAIEQGEVRNGGTL